MEENEATWTCISCHGRYPGRIPPIEANPPRCRNCVRIEELEALAARAMARAESLLEAAGINGRMKLLEDTLVKIDRATRAPSVEGNVPLPSIRLEVVRNLVRQVPPPQADEKEHRS